MPFKFEPQQYDSLLEEKKARIASLFSAFNFPEIDVYPSKKEHYRMRAEFRMWHDNDSEQQSPYPVMFKKDANKTMLRITEFPVACKPINIIVKNLTRLIHDQDILKNRLFQIECLSARSGETLLTMIYHRRLDETWEAQARELQQQLTTLMSDELALQQSVHIIGRSRKQKVVLEQDYIVEAFNVGGTKLRYQQLENSFTQSNADINEDMLNWVHKNTLQLNDDALELYCGNGNFSAVLAKNFKRVFATELVKSAVKSAHTNMKMNGLDNCEIVRLSSEEFTQAINGLRPFRRLAHIELDDYNFSTILVDPPRSGLDEDTCSMIQGYENIIYISCNPETLEQNLKTLTTTHTVESAAVFDQFPLYRSLRVRSYFKKNYLALHQFKLFSINNKK